MSTKRCEFCKNGLPEIDRTSGKWFRVCTLIPPQPTPITRIDADGEFKGLPRLVTAWVRPQMSLHGWCGQFRMSIARLLFRDGA